jgi:hypothetical protein
MTEVKSDIRTILRDDEFLSHNLSEKNVYKKRNEKNAREGKASI